MWHGLNTKDLLFYMHPSMSVHASYMTSSLSFRALVYTLDMRMIVCRHMFAGQELTHAKFGLCAFWLACEL